MNSQVQSALPSRRDVRLIRFLALPPSRNSSSASILLSFGSRRASSFGVHGETSGLRVARLGVVYEGQRLQRRVAFLAQAGTGP